MKIIRESDGIYKIGTSATENWVLLEKALDTHYFFHLSSFPSGYVILEPLGEPTMDTLIRAAVLCKQGTKYRNLRNIKVDYCLCSNITKGTKMGEAIFKSNRKVKSLSTG